MRRRIFISIGLPEEISRQLAEKVEKWRWLPIRWLKPENWHITITPPFYANEDTLYAVRDSLEKAVSNWHPPELSFDSIILAPPGKQARMIWLSGQRNDAFRDFKGMIEEELLKNDAVLKTEKEERPLFPHITLARFEEGGLKDIEQRTLILEEFKVSFPVTSIDIMESRIKSAGVEYEVLASVPFRGGFYTNA